jgi:hypothetical protein
MAEGYDPNRSQTKPDKLAAFLQSRITGDLKEVPGVGDATVAAMKANGVSTTYGLIGKYLSLKEETVESVEHCDRFFYWLKEIGTAAGYRSAVVQAIAMKMDVVFPGIYDGSCYDNA